MYVVIYVLFLFLHHNIHSTKYALVILYTTSSFDMSNVLLPATM